MKGKSGLFSSRQPILPTSFSGLTAWWDGSDSARLFNATSGGSAVAADGEIARLEDKSGGGRHLTSSTSGARPVRKTAVQNGLDVMRFDGSNDTLSSFAFTFSDLVGFTQSTFFVAAKISTLNTNQTNVYDNPAILTETQASHGFASFRSNGTVESYGRANSFIYTTSRSYTAGTWKVFTTRHADDVLSLRINGGAEGTSTLASRQNVFGYVYLARSSTGGFASRFLECDIGEIIAYNVALSASDREAVETYLIDKWAIT